MRIPSQVLDRTNSLVFCSAFWGFVDEHFHSFGALLMNISISPFLPCLNGHLSVLSENRLIEWLGLEGTPRIIRFQPLPTDTATNLQRLNFAINCDIDHCFCPERAIPYSVYPDLLQKKCSI